MKTIGSVLKRLLLALGGTAPNDYYNDITLVDKIAELAENGNISPSVIPIPNPYPVGSIYMSVESTSPASLFGGTWERIKDKFLLSAGDTYAAGGTGGSSQADHTHTLSHTHSLNDNGWAQISIHKSGGTYIRYREKQGATSYSTSYRGGLSSAASETYSGDTFGACLAGSTGGANTTTTSGASVVNNMPPYLTVYVWKRVS